MELLVVQICSLNLKPCYKLLSSFLAITILALAGKLHVCRNYDFSMCLHNMLWLFKVDSPDKV